MKKRSSSIYLNHKEEAVDKGNEKKKVKVSVKTFPNMSPSLPMRKSFMIESKENIFLNTLAFRTLIISITFSPGYIKITINYNMLISIN